MNRPSIYTRPNKPMRIERKGRRDFAPLTALALAEPLAVDSATECHTTPDDVAARMVQYLGDCGRENVLEPSAGTGQLVRALLAAGVDPQQVYMIERHNRLADNLARSLGPVVNTCFLEYAAAAAGKKYFPRVIMNPPFSKVRQHIAAALSLQHQPAHEAAPVLVALVPATFHHDRAEMLEQLPADTFALAKVSTKIIKIGG